MFIAVTQSDPRYPQFCSSLIQTRLSLITPHSTNLALKIRGEQHLSSVSITVTHTHTHNYLATERYLSTTLSDHFFAMLLTWCLFLCCVFVFVSQLCIFLINFLKSFRANGPCYLKNCSYRYPWAISNDFSSPFEIADTWRFFFFYTAYDKVFRCWL